MALQSQGTRHDRLSQLPLELLVAIFQQCADFSSLWSLMQTSRLMLSVFNNWACDIVSAVMAATVPVQTRIIMQAILSMHMGTFQCKNWDDAFYFVKGHIPPVDKVTASPTRLRNFVCLSHRIHVLAHICIDCCIQRCLESPLGQRQYAPDFEIPSWTEEQRTVLAFWRVMFWNQLKIEGSKGSLIWSLNDLQRLASASANDHFPGYAMLSPALTALYFIADEFPVRSSNDPLQDLSPHPFKLPSVPSEREFHWVCEPPPSAEAITQSWNFEQCGPSLEAMFSSRPTAHQGIQRADEESSQEATQEHRHESTIEPEETPNAGPRRFYSPDSDESEYDLGWNYDDLEEDSEDEDGESSSSSGSSSSSSSEPNSRRIATYTHCILTRVGAYVPRPVQGYGHHSSQQKEWENLDQGSLGTQFWLSISGNPADRPAKYMWFEACARYGFAIWEEQRMIQFGLWSHHALDNAVEYYRRWYTLLSPQDIDYWEHKFRYI